MTYLIISIIILIIIIIILSLNNLQEKFENNNEFNIFPPTKIINHNKYGIIKCITNDLYVCETILKGNTWEEELFNNYFEPYIKENTTILDCGSYIGSHSILMKKLNRNNDIFIFEMMPEHYKIIQDNIKLNNFDNILTFNFALGDKIDRIKLPNVNYNEDNTNYGATSINNNSSNVDINLIPLDFIMPFIIKPVSFMKIDVEGNEVSLLNGAKELITKYKPIICIEIWNLKYDEFINSDIWKYLQSINYKIKHINGDDYLLY
jgi:FkbM family methyltransferase